MSNAICARKGAYEVDVEEGKTYLWCTCGRSTTQPFCDEKSHEGTGYEPWEFTAKETGKVPLCGCKRTGTNPFCDGTHNTVEDFELLAT